MSVTNLVKMEKAHINIAHINVRSLTVINNLGRRIVRIKQFLINDCDCDVIACTETHLDSTVEDHEVEIEGYQLIRKDRNRKGGGVGIYVRDNIHFVRIYELESPDAETIWIEIKQNNSALLFGVCYRPPGQLVGEVEAFLSSLEQTLYLAQQKNLTKLVLMGDFNDPCLKWDSIHCRSELKNDLLNLTLAFNLKQLVLEPTTDLNLLDLIFTNSTDLISEVKVLNPIHDLDHCPVFAKILFRVNKKNPKYILERYGTMNMEILLI